MSTLDEILMQLETSEIMILVAVFFIINTSMVFIGMLIDLLKQLFSRKSKSGDKRNWKDTAANTSIFMFTQFLESTVFGIIAIVCLYPIYHWNPIEIPTTALTWVLSLVLADLTYYWMHRIEHEHRILWANHSVHHSSQDYNLSVSFRLSVIEGAFEWIFLIPMILLGFDLFQAMVSLIFVVQYQAWIHTENIGKLGWLDKVFNTPSVHRVHHGSNPQYIDKNYGGVLMLWDHLFGTYQKEEEKVIYGLTKNIDTNNPITINFREYIKIIKDVYQCRNYRDRFKIIFGGLVWRPSYFEK